MLLNYSSLVDEFNVNVTGVIHVGGHIGEELETYRSRNLKNLIIFEPQKHCFDQIVETSKKLGMSEIKIVNKALGNLSGQMEIISDPTGLCGSLLEPKIVLTYPDIVFSERFMVDVSKMDDEIDEDHSYNFLNMDVQGYELEVLKGGKRTLEKIQYVYTEVNRDEVYENCAMIEEIDEFLSQFNFKRVKESWKGEWGDAFYVKE